MSGINLFIIIFITASIVFHYSNGRTASSTKVALVTKRTHSMMYLKTFVKKTLWIFKILIGVIMIRLVYECKNTTIFIRIMNFLHPIIKIIVPVLEKLKSFIILISPIGRLATTSDFRVISVTLASFKYGIIVASILIGIFLITTAGVSIVKIIGIVIFYEFVWWYLMYESALLMFCSFIKVAHLNNIIIFLYAILIQIPILVKIDSCITK